MIDRNSLTAIIVGVCIVNGIFSPYLAIALQVVPILMPEMFPKTVEWALFFSSIFVSSATLIFGGVPAALYERFFAGDENSLASMWIWLGAATLLSLPALETIHKVL
jgi:hypothetical protein